MDGYDVVLWKGGGKLIDCSSQSVIDTAKRIAGAM